MNKNKGFSLIELLAVIVVLAIIAIIAMPIAENIIQETKKNSTLRSAISYKKSVELAITENQLIDKVSDGTYKIMSDGNICVSYELDNITCSKTLKVYSKGSRPTEGDATIIGGKVTNLNMILNKREITTNSKGEIVFIKTLDETCKHISGEEKTKGSKYECKVDPNKDPYTFYVLSTPTSDDTSINLIMDRNINNDGTPATKGIRRINIENGIYNKLEWINYDDFISSGGEQSDWDNSTNLNIYGPVSAMKFLSEATKTWTNTNEIIVDHFTDSNGAYEMKNYNTHARMPYMSEITTYDSTYKTNVYLYNYMKLSGSIQTKEIATITGYWLLSIKKGSSANALYASYTGKISNIGVGSDKYVGVRPVINLKI